MSKEFGSFLEKYKKTVNESLRLAYITRGIELQRRAITRLGSIATEADVWRCRFQSTIDEDRANRCLAYRMLAGAIEKTLEVWVHIKEDLMREAWDSLVEAQMSIQTALQAHNCVKEMEWLAETLQNIEEVVFPKQMFFSAGMIVKRSKCSICGSNYEECSHIIGRPYLGEICSQIIEEIDELREVSVVEVPSDKRCRVLEYGEGDNKHDTLTLRHVREVSSKNRNA